MSPFKALSIIFKFRRDLKRHGILDAIYDIFRPRIRKFEREAKDAVGDIMYFEYEYKSIQYDLERLNERKEKLDYELENLSKSLKQFQATSSRSH